MMKPMRAQITIQDGMISVETPGLKEVGDFYYSGLFTGRHITGFGMQANHVNPEWPKLADKLTAACQEFIKVWYEHQKAELPQDKGVHDGPTSAEHNH
jgi:hypothetical protein